MLDVIRARRSIRKFDGRPVSEEDRAALVETALRSPTSRNRRATEFVFVDEPETLRMLSAAKPQGGEFLAGAPLGVVVLGDPAANDCFIEDGSIAAAHLMLAATSLGLGSCWVQIRGRPHADGRPSSEHVKRIVSAPDRLEALSVLAIGHPAEKRPPWPDADLPHPRVHRGRFG